MTIPFGGPLQGRAVVAKPHVFISVDAVPTVVIEAMTAIGVLALEMRAMGSIVSDYGRYGDRIGTACQARGEDRQRAVRALVWRWHPFSPAGHRADGGGSQPIFPGLAT